ncbi:BPL-N domain-containing protein [Pseudomonas oryzihabitans]|uniref:BPL-N domain-containing protein n=1 Tax=Pseudomonas oryzihabitans TaxID=47885 RepID=UPI0028944BFD|nr:BPL-N domain-containing protein [Pseudomonas oryzihabitans]MDT3718267.1 BPL-N domain-containing protein [Pseudomonas oryzihabitans]
MRFPGIALILIVSLAVTVILSLDIDRPDIIRIAVYRGPAACEGCAEAVKEAIERLDPAYRVDFLGPHEHRDVSSSALAQYDAYVQPGGGQDIPAALNSLGEQRSAAIRAYVAKGGQYLGICMGAYLADAANLGLIDTELDSEVGRPGFPVTTIEDSSVPVRWGGLADRVFFQDGPYFPRSTGNGFRLIASYGNGDIAAARYRFGAGVVVLSGPHPEADASWFQDAGIPENLQPRHDLFRIVFEALDS